MFKPARMKKLKIVTLDKYADAAVNALHEASVVQIQDISERIQTDAEWKQILKPSHATPFLGKISSLLMKTTAMSDFLDSVSRKDEGILAIAKGLVNPPTKEKKQVAEVEVKDLLEKTENILGEIESKTKPLDLKRTELDAESARLENAIKVSENLDKFDTDIGDLATRRYVSVIAGKLSLTSYEQFKESQKDLPEEIVFDESDSDDKEFKILVVITLKQYEDEVSSLLRKMEFEKFNLSGISGKSEEIIKNSKSEIEYAHAGHLSTYFFNLFFLWRQHIEITTFY